MIRAKCIRKNRDKKGNILNYVLQDSAGAMRIATSNQIKTAIINKQIIIDNLQIDKAGRLVDKAQEKAQMLKTEQSLNSNIKKDRVVAEENNKISLGMNYIRNINKVFPGDFKSTKKLLEKAYKQKNHISFESHENNIALSNRDMPKEAVDYINNIKNMILKQIEKTFILFYIDNHESVEYMIRKSKVPACITDFYNISNCNSIIYSSLILIFVRELIEKNNVLICDNIILIQGLRKKDNKDNKNTNEIYLSKNKDITKKYMDLLIKRENINKFEIINLDIIGNDRAKSLYKDFLKDKTMSNTNEYERYQLEKLHFTREKGYLQYNVLDKLDSTLKLYDLKNPIDFFNKEDLMEVLLQVEGIIKSIVNILIKKLNDGGLDFIYNSGTIYKTYDLTEEYSKEVIEYEEAYKKLNLNHDIKDGIYLCMMLEDPQIECKVEIINSDDEKIKEQVNNQKITYGVILDILSKNENSYIRLYRK